MSSHTKTGQEEIRNPEQKRASTFRGGTLFVAKDLADETDVGLYFL